MFFNIPCLRSNCPPEPKIRISSRTILLQCNDTLGNFIKPKETRNFFLHQAAVKIYIASICFTPTAENKILDATEKNRNILGRRYSLHGIIGSQHVKCKLKVETLYDDNFLARCNILFMFIQQQQNYKISKIYGGV